MVSRASLFLGLPGATALGDSRVLYTTLVVLVAVERAIELSVSRRNARATLARGGREFGREHYPVMVLLHALFLPACVIEVWLLERPFVPALGVPCLVLLALAQGLRYWAISSLGGRWSTRVVCVPGEPVIVLGPYRWLRHPNYLAVVSELFALPMVHTAWASALLFGLSNAVLLRVRIAVEEAALREHCDWRGRFARGAAGAGGSARDSRATPSMRAEP